MMIGKKPMIDALHHQLAVNLRYAIKYGVDDNIMVDSRDALAAYEAAKNALVVPSGEPDWHLTSTMRQHEIDNLKAECSKLRECLGYCRNLLTDAGYDEAAPIEALCRALVKVEAQQRERAERAEARLEESYKHDEGVCKSVEDWTERTRKLEQENNDLRVEVYARKTAQEADSKTINNLRDSLNYHNALSEDVAKIKDQNGTRILQWLCGDICNCSYLYVYDGEKILDKSPYVGDICDDQESQIEREKWIKNMMIKYNIKMQKEY